MSQYTQRSASVLQEERPLLAYFQQSTFDNPANFEIEIRHLLTGNYGEILQRRALFSQQPRFRGDPNGKIVSALAEAWEVPPPKIFAIYNELPAERQLDLNAVVARVASDLNDELADEIGYADAPAEYWGGIQERKEPPRGFGATAARGKLFGLCKRFAILRRSIVPLIVSSWLRATNPPSPPMRNWC